MVAPSQVVPSLPNFGHILYVSYTLMLYLLD